MSNKPKRVGGAGGRRTGQGQGNSDKGKGRKVFITPQKNNGDLEEIDNKELMSP